MLPKNTSAIITRLTALWALSECALGGIMHAFKVPFTGIFVGGFAVVIIALIAFNSENKFTSILRATLFVLMVKSGVSPHTPVPAYIAVAFQGLAGAIVFTLVSNYKIASVTFSFIAITESAIQKFLFTTLLFGKSFWTGIDAFVKSVLADLHISNDFSFSVWAVSSYVLLYAVWGIAIGFFIGGMPKALEQIKTENIQIAQEDISIKKKKSMPKWVHYLLISFFIVIVFYLDGKTNQAIYIILRSIAVTMILFVIVRPLIVFLINKVGKNKQTEVNEILMLLPEIRKFVKPSFILAGKHFTGIKKYKSFVLYLIYFSTTGIDNAKK